MEAETFACKFASQWLKNYVIGRLEKELFKKPIQFHIFIVVCYLYNNTDVPGV